MTRSGGCSRRRWLRTIVGLWLGLTVVPAVANEVRTDQGRKVATTGRTETGAIWGRLLVEEESPEGPWTPLAGVDVRLLPDPAPLVAELERVRQAGRGSWRGHDLAATRVRAALEAHEARVRATGDESFQQTTDAWGLFRFEMIPAGEWVVVATRVAPYRRPAPQAPSLKSQRRRSGFLDQAAEVAREAELWVAVVQVERGGRSRVILTDRARWMAGPVR